LDVFGIKKDASVASDDMLEVLAGIEPAITELQSVALAPWLQNRYSNPLYQKMKVLFQQSAIRFGDLNA